MVIIVHCDLYLKEDKDLLSKVAVMVEESRKDKGCIEYSFFNEPLNPSHYMMVEQWESKELLDAHLKAPHFGVFDSYIKTISIKEAKINLFVA